MTFNEFVERQTWYVVEGLLRGEPLRELIWEVVSQARMWEKI